MILAVVLMVLVAVGKAVAVAIGVGGGGDDSSSVTQVTIFNTVYQTECTTQIIISGAEQSGTVPEDLRHLTDWEELDLSGHHFMETVPTDLAVLSKLTSLDVSDNSLTEPGPSKCGSMTTQTNLDVHGNQGLAGAIPPQIANLVNLSTLWLYGTGLVGVISSNFCSFRGNVLDIRIDSGDVECSCFPVPGGMFVRPPSSEQLMLRPSRRQQRNVPQRYQLRPRPQVPTIHSGTE